MTYGEISVGRWIGGTAVAALAVAVVVAVAMQTHGPAPRPAAGATPAPTSTPSATTRPARSAAPKATTPTPTKDTAASRTELVAVQWFGERSQLALVSTVTGRTTRVLRFRADTLAQDVDLTPDRRSVYYATDETKTGFDRCGAVYRLTLHDGIVRRVMPKASRPRLSPDGRWLAMLTGCPADHLTLLDLRTGARRDYPLGPAFIGGRSTDGHYEHYIDAVRDLTWRRDGTLALLGRVGEEATYGTVLFDPAKHTRLGQGRRFEVEGWHWQIRTLGDDLLLAGKHRLTLWDSGTGRLRSVLGRRDWLIADVAVGPDGRIAYEENGHLWFADEKGRHRRGPRANGEVADW